jgi:hypothetical protein
VRSFEPIEKPSKRLAKIVDQDDVVRDLAHDVDLEPILAALQSLLGHRREHLVGLVQAATERDHDPQILQPHLSPHPAHGGALQRKGREP